MYRFSIACFVILSVVSGISPGPSVALAQEDGFATIQKVDAAMQSASEELHVRMELSGSSRSAARELCCTRPWSRGRCRRITPWLLASTRPEICRTNRK